MKKLKVWGGRPLGRERYIVAAHNQKDAAKAMKCSLHHLQGYTAITGDQEEIDAAIANPNILILSPRQ